MDGEDIGKTAFVMHHRHFKYTRMSLKLESALATFRCAMGVIPASVKWQHATIYIDDIIIFSETEEEHLKHTDIVHRLSKDVRLTIKLIKCFSFSKTIHCLGHVIAPVCLQVARKTTEVNKTLRYPTTVSEMWFFYGLYNADRRFVANFARHASPLNKKLRKGGPRRLE